MTWAEAVRYCGWYKNSIAQSLYVKAKRGDRLSSKQVECVYVYAERAKIVYGGQIVQVRIAHNPFPLTVEGFKLERRGDWVVCAQTVFGKIQGNTLSIYPNGSVHPLAIRRACTGL